MYRMLCIYLPTKKIYYKFKTYKTKIGGSTEISLGWFVHEHVHHNKYIKKCANIKQIGFFFTGNLIYIKPHLCVP